MKCRVIRLWSIWQRNPVIFHLPACYNLRQINHLDASLENKQYQQLVNRAALTSTGVASSLVVLKVIGWLATGSAAMLASLLDSLMDAMTSAINLLSLRFAQKPADDEHRFGHGKAEGLAALAQGAFISGSSLLLMLHGVDRLLNAQPLKQIQWGLVIMVIAIIATLALVSFQRWVVKRTQSVVVKADLLHYQSDVMMNIAILISLLLSQFGVAAADGLFAIGISLYMLWGVKGVVTEAMSSLMDRELPDEERDCIVEIALTPDEVLGVHDIRTRQSANVRFIQLHIELEDQLSLLDAHSIADRVEAQLIERFPASDVIIHLDPISVVPVERREYPKQRHHNR